MPNERGPYEDEYQFPQVPQEATAFSVPNELMESATSFIRDWSGLCYDISRSKGFWHQGRNRNKGEQISLMHSELSEVLEAVRKPGPDSHLPNLSSEAVEMADLLIRWLDYVRGWDMVQDVTEALRAKIEYNTRRPHMHGKNM